MCKVLDRNAVCLKELTNIKAWAKYPDLQEEEECTPLVVCETEEHIAVYLFPDALVMLHEAVLIPFRLSHGNVHGLHPAVLNRKMH